jgi:DNA-binding CsgD family transcriptional regulator
MYRQSIITTLLIILTTSCFAQNVDSLILAAENLKGKSKSAAYEKIGLEFYQQDFTIKAKEYFNKSLEVSKEVDDTLGQMNALKGLLRVAYHKEDSVELSREYAGHLEELSVDSGNKLMQAYVLHHKGRANKEDFELSINRMKRALDIYEATGVKESTNIVYRELGEALLDTAPTEAFMYFQKNLELAEELNYPEEIYLARSNISSALISMKQYEDARNFCERNIEIAKEANNQDFLAYNYLLIGISYKNEKNYSKAIEYAMQGKEICEENDLMDKKQYTYQLLKEIYNERGNYTEAFQFFAKEKQIEAALEKEKTVNKLAAINAQFELEKRNQEIEAFKKIKYYENLVKNGLLIFLGIVALFLYQLSVRRRLKVQLQKEELEKLKVEQMLETEERERLKERLEYKERELASNTMFMLQKNKMLTDLKEKIGTIKVSNDEQLRKQVNSIDRNIEMNMNFDDDWQKFKLHFAEVHPNFFEKLYQESNALNNNETRFCAYIRMGLTTKEIAQLMGISAGSVQKARYRLKKKLELEKEVNLIEYISTL